ncbi:MAG: hypothetical protein SWQ30_23260 [Thermodesulfobacteriota bacterium]|nr:hypothetical protein [Thermodesulfobacteriota bacterium]
MKAEYDFSKGTRGKFYHPNAVFGFPVYLEPDVDDFEQTCGGTGYRHSETGQRMAWGKHLSEKS